MIGLCGIGYAEGVTGWRPSGTVRLSLLVFVPLIAVLTAAPAASACTAGAYTECIPSAPSGGGGGGGSGSAGGGSGGVSAANASSPPPSSAIPMTASDATSGSSSPSDSHTAGAAAGPKQKTHNRRHAASGHKKPLANTTPARLASSSGGGGGVPTIAWILAALAVVCLGAGSAQVLRSRRGSTATPRRT